MTFIPPEFDQFARKYDDLLYDPIRDRFTGRSNEYFHQRKLEMLLDFFSQQRISPRSMDWLDVGCGRGELLRMGRPHFASVSGCDISSEMIKEVAGVKIRQQTTPYSIPFPDRMFHLVTAVCVYHHVPLEVRPQLTDEIHRVLQPGGLGCIIEHNPWNPVTRLIVSRAPIDVDAKLLSVLTAKRLLTNAMLAPAAARHFLYLSVSLYSRLRVIEKVLSSVPFGGQYAIFGRRQT